MAAASRKEGMLIFKIASKGAWAEALRTGAFTGSEADRRDGFIHLSDAGQIAETAAKHFKGQDDLVLVAFEAATLGPALKWEPSRGGALFPHLYEPLPVGHALWVRSLALGADGVPIIPDLATC